MKKGQRDGNVITRLEDIKHKMKKNSYCYDDIINLPHPTSKVHPRMPRIDRAAQFAPFAALSGHGDEIREAARFTVEQIEISEDMRKELDKTFEELLQSRDKQPLVEITYFERDIRKQGGRYTTIKGYVKKVDFEEHILYLEDGSAIKSDTIFKLDIQR